MFSRKFQRLAEQFSDAIFLDIMGDETSDTRVSPAELVKMCAQHASKGLLLIAEYSNLQHVA